MPDVDTKLATSLKQAKTKPMFFAFVAKGASDGALIVSKKKIPVKEINEAKEASGGKLVFKGRCQGEDGKMVFEILKEPPGTLAKQVKTVIHRDAGLTLMVEFRQSADAENEGQEESTETPDTDDDSEEGSIPPAPPMAPDGTAVMARLNALAGPLKLALAGPNATRVQVLFGAVNGFVKAKDFVQAAKVLDELQPLLAKVAPAPPPPPPADGAAMVARLNTLAGPIKTALAGPNATRVQVLFGAVNGLVKNKDFTQAGKVLDELEPLLAKAPPAPTDGAAVISRLNALGGRIKTALAGPEATRVQTLFGAVNGLVKNKDFVQASKVLDELEPLLNAPPPPPPPPPPAEDGVTVISRLNALAGLVKAALAGPNAARVQTLFGAVNGLVKNKDFVQASKVLDELEPLVKGTAPAPKQGVIVAMQTSRLRWDQTRKQVQVDLQALEKEILAECKAINDDPNEEEEIDLGELAGKTKVLYTILDKLDERLMDKLDEALNSKTPELRDQKQKEAVGIIKEYQGMVSSDPLLNQIDNSGFFSTSIKQTFTNVLNDLASKL